MESRETPRNIKVLVGESGSGKSYWLERLPTPEPNGLNAIESSDDLIEKISPGATQPTKNRLNDIFEAFSFTPTIIEEVEIKLHPKAQAILMDIILEILDRHESLQVYLTTHSPYIVDRVRCGEVLVFAKRNGEYRHKLLSENGKSGWAMGALTPGEFWDAEGEDWLFEVNYFPPTLTSLRDSAVTLS